jgi:hypothetical protein
MSIKTAAERRRTPPTSVADARDQVKDCDIIICSGRYLISRIFEWITNGRYSHAAIAVHWGDKLMLCQAEAVGVQAVPLWDAAKKYNGRCYWYRLKGDFPDKLHEQRILDSAKSDLGLEYGYWTIIREMLYRYFGFSKPNQSGKPTTFFCSQYVAACFRSGGIVFAPGKSDSEVLPGDISDSPRVEFMGRITYVNGEEVPERMTLQQDLAEEAHGA